MLVNINFTFELKINDICSLTGRYMLLLTQIYEVAHQLS